MQIYKATVSIIWKDKVNRIRHITFCSIILVLPTTLAMEPTSYKRQLYDKMSTTVKKIPDGLKLGVATAAFQIEGACDAADKTPSIWDTFSKKPGTIKDNSSPNETCMSYKYYERDVKMMKFLGVDFYRFSISWPRILPNGFANKISKDGYQYYSNLIDKLLVNGIEPVVTIYHWDLPQNLQDLGGWANPDVVLWFEDYAKVLYQLFGDRVKTWITLNEPKQFGVYGYGTPRFAPGINAHGIGEYMVIKNMLLAHARAWRLYDSEFREKQKGICGITIATDFREGLTDSPEDIEVGKLAMDFEVGLYSHPIFSTDGGFPERVIRRVAERSLEQGYPRSRLPELNKCEIEYIKGTSDFYGFNHYSTKFYSTVDFKPGMFPVPSYDDDIGATTTYLDFEKGSVVHCTIIPHGIRKALKWVKETCNDPPIMITENGFGTFGGLDDDSRISYYKKYINAMLEAIEEDKCNVISYTAWSLMDNFEWDNGLRSKFGLFEIDFNDKQKTRKARSSAFWYRNLIANRTLYPNYKPVLQDVSF